MQSRKSYFSVTLLKKNIVRFWPVIAAYLVYLIVKLPLAIFDGEYASAFSDSIAEGAVVLDRYMQQAAESAITPALIMAIAFIAAALNFGYLFNDRSANGFHALPFCREQLYFTNVVSSLLMLIIPQVITFVVSVGCFVLIGYSNMLLLLTWLLYSMCYSFIFTGFAVFAVMITGKYIGMLVFYVFELFGIEIIRCICMEVLEQIVYGAWNDGLMNNDIFAPGFYIIFRTRDYAIDNWRITALYVIPAIVMYGMAMWMYKIRRIERTGDLVIFAPLRQIFVYGFAICFGTFVAVIVNSIILSGNYALAFGKLLTLILIFSLAFLAIGKMIIMRSIKVFNSRLVAGWAVMGIVVAVLLTGAELDVTGAEKYIPASDNIASAEIVFGTDLTDSASENINAIRQLHQAVIDAKRHNETMVQTESDEYTSLAISYKLTSGRQIKRVYRIPASATELADSTSLANTIATFENQPENIIKSLFGDDLSKVSVVYASMINVSSASDSGYSQEELSLGDSELQDVFEAVISDIEDGKAPQAILSNGDYNDDLYANSICLYYYVEDKSEIQSAEIRFYTYSSSMLKVIDKYNMTGGKKLYTIKQVEESAGMYYNNDSLTTAFVNY